MSGIQELKAGLAQLFHVRESVVKTGQRPPRLSGLCAGYRCNSASNFLFMSGSRASSRRLCTIADSRSPISK